MSDAAVTPIPVILSGGAGSRLWPLSRTHFPKQFIPLIDGRSLLDCTLDRVRSLAPGMVVTVCNEAHRFFAAEQLQDAGFDNTLALVEPCSRNTAPAVTLAALALAERGEKTPLLVLPSDHYIPDSAAFASCVERAVPAAAGGALVMFGIKPSRPEAGYGYIIAGRRLESGAQRVAQFVEKPGIEDTRKYVASDDCYWNSGIFMFTAKTWLSELEQHAPGILEACCDAWQTHSRDRIMNLDFVRVDEKNFARNPDISIDYAVMEKTSGAVVFPVQLEWSDLGSWDAVAGLFRHDADGNAVSGGGKVVLEECSGNVVYASRRLVAAVGLEHHIVVETPDAVFITERGRAQDVKQLVARLRADRCEESDWHRKVYRPWGSYEGVDSGEGFQVKRIIVKPQGQLSLQRHRCRSEHWIIVRGTAVVTRDDETLTLQANESTYIPVGVKHRLENPGDEPLHLIEVQCGDYLGEDDIERFEDSYGRTHE